MLWLSKSGSKLRRQRGRRRMHKPKSRLHSGVWALGGLWYTHTALGLQADSGCRMHIRKVHIARQTFPLCKKFNQGEPQSDCLPQSDTLYLDNGIQRQVKDCNTGTSRFHPRKMSYIGLIRSHKIPKTLQIHIQLNYITEARARSF